MTSDEFDALLYARPCLQDVSFHLVEVPNDKKYRKEEKEMKQTFRLKKTKFYF